MKIYSNAIIDPSDILRITYASTMKNHNFIVYTSLEEAYLQGDNTPFGSPNRLKKCNCTLLVVKSDHMREFLAPLKPKRYTANYLNIVSISIFVTFSIYIANVKVIH